MIDQVPAAAEAPRVVRRPHRVVRPPYRAGFSLVEVVIAAGVMGVVSLALHLVTMASLEEARGAARRVQAGQLAQQCLELVVDPLASAPSTGWTTTIPAAGGYYCTVKVAPHRTEPGVLVADVGVEWEDRPGGPTHQVQLGRLVAAHARAGAAP